MDGSNGIMSMSVVIVNYNTRVDLRACLGSVLAARPGEVIVADNGSTDGSREMVKDDYPDVKLLCFDDNPGYGGAANRAIAATSAPYVLLLNSDTILETDGIGALADYLEANPGVAVAGPRLINTDGSLQPSCYPFPGSFRWTWDNDLIGPLLHRFGISGLRTWAHGRSRPVPWVKGAALAIRRSFFDDVGGFDESYFMYHEETDLCYRLWQAGYATHFAPVTEVRHAGGMSTSQYAERMSAELHRAASRFHHMHLRGAHRALVNVLWRGLGRVRGVPESADVPADRQQDSEP